MTNFQSLDEALKETSKLKLTGTATDTNGDGWISCHEHVINSIIRSVWESASQVKPGDTFIHVDVAKKLADDLVKAERERVKEIIESKGHQQKDDTIWCNMDELLESLT